MHFREITAYNIGLDIRLRVNNALVCYDLESRRFLIFGDKSDTVDLKIQAIRLKDWLLEDRQVLDALKRGDKEIRAVIHQFPKPPPIRRRPITRELRP